MGLTQIFLCVFAGATILAIAIFISGNGTGISNKLSVALNVIATLLSIAAIVGLIGAVWSWNSNSRETHNRCVESGGIVMRINDARHCLEEAPKIKFKM